VNSSDSNFTDSFLEKLFTGSNRVYQFVSVLVIDGFSENSFEV